MNVKNDRMKIVKEPSPNMQDDDDVTETLPQIKTSTKKERTLKLDEKNHRPSRTRGELYKELTKHERQAEEEDYYDFSDPAPRAVALGIDAVFAFAIVKLGMLTAPLEVKLIHTFFLDKYNLQFMFGEDAFLKVITGLSIGFLVFLSIVIPVAFFNVSLGKKLTNLRIRGDHKYTLGLTQAFQREIIYKPISIALLAGFILPFFDKKKKSLHDKMAGTFVIKE